MQKKVIALAVAGLMSGAAFAQSNVTISGRVDVGYQATSVSKTGSAVDKTTGINSGNHDGSRLAFSGEENLGNGMKAIFMLEYSLANDINSGLSNGSRQQWLGLSSSMGTVTAGQVYAPADDIAMFDAMDETNFSPRALMGGFLTGSGATAIASRRYSNAVKYVAPTMSGLTVSAVYGFSHFAAADNTAYNASVGANQDQERGFGVGGTYTNGPLSLGLYHDRANDAANVENDKYRLTRFGASYDFGVVALMTTYETGSIKSNAATIVSAVGTDKGKIWSLGATMPLGNGLVRAQYSKGTVNDETSVSSDGAKGWGLGYDYNLSKRTMLYSGIARIKADSNQNAASTTTFATQGGGNKMTTYGFGMLHKF